MSILQDFESMVRGKNRLGKLMYNGQCVGFRLSLCTEDSVGAYTTKYYDFSARSVEDKKYQDFLRGVLNELPCFELIKRADGRLATEVEIRDNFTISELSSSTEICKALQRYISSREEGESKNV